jgi:dehydrogluconokinase
MPLPTGFQLKARCDDGSDPSVEYFRRGSAASRLSPALIHSDVLQARHLHATGIPPALSDSCRALSHALLDAMRAAGRSISFDPNLRPSLWPDQSSMVREINALATKADWVLPGLEEGRLLTGQQTPADIAAFYLDQGVELVVIKLGEAGAYLRSAKGEGQVAAVPVSHVVDTVGAGDAFAVGVLSALLEGRAVAEAVARGNWCGSRAVQSRGDMEGCRCATSWRPQPAQRPAQQPRITCCNKNNKLRSNKPCKAATWHLAAGGTSSRSCSSPTAWRTWTAPTTVSPPPLAWPTT